MYYLQYLIYCIVGAILFTVSYYCSQHSNHIISALIPALPILGFFGLFLLEKNRSNVLEYLGNLMVFCLFYMLLFGIMYVLYEKTNNLLLSFIVALMFWAFLVVYSIL